jgi:hypothetical protein
MMTKLFVFERVPFKKVDWAAAAFGLFVAGLVAWLVALYWAAPFDF